ncbi:aromatic acid exporter family protein [Desemzia incerta]|uniref:aromatic acid exporter family protein n=1 Tax=Desemzia incerta TaxID=82801 RepID=UPI0024C245F5|nr:aromatic acid exporter family protein [Desemzia incerta]WHZ32075.1 aromatic acid exporter family protein [Desemzia incerta]
MSLSLRTLKIALSTVAAIFIADLFHLESSISAGIIAILSVLDTRKTSLEIAVQRVVSTVLALGIAAILFNVLGFSTAVFGLYLLFYVPSAYKLNVQSGIAPCSVLVTHLLLAESTAPGLLFNELSLMLIGAGMALAVNLYMPSQENRIADIRTQVEEQMKVILFQFDHFLQNGIEEKISNKDLVQLNHLLEQGIQLSRAEAENRFIDQSYYHFRYFEMRKSQARILEQMQWNLKQISIPLQQSRILAGMYYLTAENLHEYNPGINLLEEIDQLTDVFRESDLPETREEFEKRAVLFQLLNDFERFIQIKKDFYDEYSKEWFAL